MALTSGITIGLFADPSPFLSTLARFPPFCIWSFPWLSRLTRVLGLWSVGDNQRWLIGHEEGKRLTYNFHNFKPLSGMILRINDGLACKTGENVLSTWNDKHQDPHLQDEYLRIRGCLLRVSFLQLLPSAYSPKTFCCSHCMVDPSLRTDVS